ncbi:GntR family transcriptional regulator [Paeniglutamicibacter sp. NPDC091659]|uniref:GntR family transcriptional regulator n=1 Tax=Paeniglutamicibacter sp. NPDC091659 TaxID=3364389 RepID=UPI003807041C
MNTSKSEAAYRLLHTRITEGTFTPGYRLVLGTIANELGCSVVPVREAIRRLEAEGMVNFERNVGATVAAADSALYLHTMQTLAIIEGAATALSAPFVDADQLAAARAINQAMTDLLTDFDPPRFTELNNEFHQVLYRNCPNPHILDLVHRGWNRLALMRSSSFTHIPGRARESVREHAQLLDMIEAQAPAAEIEQAARAHRTNTLNAYLAAANLPASPL